MKPNAKRDSPWRRPLFMLTALCISLLPVKGSRAEICPMISDQLAPEEVASYDTLSAYVRDAFQSYADDFLESYNAELDGGMTPAQARDTVFFDLGGEFQKLAAFVLIESFNATIRRGSAELAGARAETARTDKQLGAGASTSGTTSLVEKAGFPALLALAVEHGAAQEERSGTSTTFSTTPYSLAVLGRHDDLATYRRFKILQRMGLAGTFNLDEGSSEGAGGLTADSFSTFSAKLRLYGDRSTRADAFVNEWTAEVAPAVRRELELQRNTLLTLLDKDGPLLAATARAEEQYHATLGQRLTGPGAAQVTANSVIEDAWRSTCEEIVVAYRNGNLALSDDVKNSLTDSMREMAAASREADQRLANVLEAYKTRPLVTADYTLHNTDGGSDYSEGKMLAEGVLGPLSFNLNASASFYHQPDPAKDQDSLRDYGASLGVEWATDAPGLQILKQPADLSQITFALAARISRLEEIENEIASVQLRIEWPLASGFSIPISLNWSNRSETNSDDEFRVGIGVALDADKMLALSRFLTAGGLP